DDDDDEQELEEGKPLSGTSGVEMHTLVHGLGANRFFRRVKKTTSSGACKAGPVSGADWKVGGTADRNLGATMGQRSHPIRSGSRQRAAIFPFGRSPAVCRPPLRVPNAPSRVAQAFLPAVPRAF